MSLLEKIRTRALDPSTIHDMAEGLSPAPKINTVITKAELEKTEAELDFKFPELLVDIYTKIGNGGFGPGYGLYSIEEAKKLYAELMSVEENEWERGTWPLCTWGCAIDSYVDCENEIFVVYYTNEGHSSHEENHATFELTDKDGNIISSGNANNINDAPDNTIGGANRPHEHEEEEDEDENEDNDEPGLLYHKDSLDEWFSDWCDGVNLWDEMSGEEEDEEEEIDPPEDLARIH